MGRAAPAVGTSQATSVPTCRRRPRRRTRTGPIAVVCVACTLVVLALALAPRAGADITTGCGASIDQPSCERLQAIYELLRDGTAQVALYPDNGVQLENPGNTVRLDPTGSPSGNVVALSTSDGDHLDAISNALHGDLWVIVGILAGTFAGGFILRAVFWESQT